MRAKCQITYLLGFGLISAGAWAQTSPARLPQKSGVYVRGANGEFLQAPREYSVQDTEHEGMGHNANRRNTAVMLRLPGAKSTVRFKEGDAIEFWAELPNRIDPRKVELLKFETRGQQRIAFISAFGARSSEPHWNTVTFRAKRTPDGNWLLEPANQPVPGEYCFTLPSGNEHFCFGVDKK